MFRKGRNRRFAQDPPVSNRSSCPAGSTLFHPAYRYALSELQKDIESELLLLPESERDSKRTQFGIFVVHNKLKPKLWELPPNIP